MGIHCLAFHGALHDTALCPRWRKHSTQKLRKSPPLVPGDSRTSRAVCASENLESTANKAHRTVIRDVGAKAASLGAPTVLEGTASAVPEDDVSSRSGWGARLADASEDDDVDAVDPDSRPMSLDDLYRVNSDVPEEVRGIVLAPGYGPPVSHSPVTHSRLPKPPITVINTQPYLLSSSPKIVTTASSTCYRASRY